MKKIVKIVAGAATFGVLSSAVFQSRNYLASYYGNTQTQTESAATNKVESTGITNVSANSGNEIAGVSDVVDNVIPSIVAIDVKVVEKQQDFFGRTYESEGEGSGSGIIFKEDSDYIYIVTNNHVVDSSVSVVVTFNDDTTANATVVGTDSDSDLAVAKVAKKDLKETTLSKIKVATMADSSQIKVGEQAIAIGNALGYGTSVTVGYVSAKDREISAETNSKNNSQKKTSTNTMKLIQTDAAINPGNSGGALVDAKGQVIGINSSKFASEEVEGMGFAIPISSAVPIIEKMISTQGNSSDTNSKKDSNDANNSSQNTNGNAQTDEVKTYNPFQF